MGQKANIIDFPEEVTLDGVKIYGETSYENQMAVLSHYLHNNREEVDDEKKEEIILAIREFISRKQFRQHSDDEDLTDEQIWKVAESPMEYNLFDDFFKVPFPAPENPKFTFIDLFAGIGGFRIAFQNLGGKCVYSSEFDAKAQESYLANYGEMPFGDITKESTKSYIPQNFDILCGGFPCQAFSLAGRRLGFKDETRGTLFFEIEAILRKHQPQAFFLENVKGFTTFIANNQLMPLGLVADVGSTKTTTSKGINHNTIKNSLTVLIRAWSPVETLLRDVLI